MLYFGRLGVGYTIPQNRISPHPLPPKPPAGGLGEGVWEKGFGRRALGEGGFGKRVRAIRFSHTPAPPPPTFDFKIYLFLNNLS